MSKASICSIISAVYPAALRSSWDMPVIFSRRLWTACVRVSEDTTPSVSPCFSASLKLSESATSLSKASPLSRATSWMDSMNPPSSAMPWSSSCFQPELRPPLSNSFLAWEVSLITPPMASDTSVSTSLASSKSPTRISHVVVQPD